MITILIRGLRCGSEVWGGVPVNRQEWREVVLVTHRGQAGEYVLHVSVRVCLPLLFVSVTGLSPWVMGSRFVLMKRQRFVRNPPMK